MIKDGYRIAAAHTSQTHTGAAKLLHAQQKAGIQLGGSLHIPYPPSMFLGVCFSFGNFENHGETDLLPVLGAGLEAFYSSVSPLPSHLSLSFCCHAYKEERINTLYLKERNLFHPIRKGAKHLCSC